MNTQQTTRPMVTVKAPTSFDVYTAADVRTKLRAAIDAGAGTLILDLDAAPVEFMDSTSLGVMIAADRYAKAHGCLFGVVCTWEPALRMFRQTNVINCVKVRGSAEEVSRG